MRELLLQNGFKTSAFYDADLAREEKGEVVPASFSIFPGHGRSQACNIERSSMACDSSDFDWLISSFYVPFFTAVLRLVEFFGKGHFTTREIAVFEMDVVGGLDSLDDTVSHLSGADRPVQLVSDRRDSLLHAGDMLVSEFGPRDVEDLAKYR